jgi:hypothetical protein
VNQPIPRLRFVLLVGLLASVPASGISWAVLTLLGQPTGFLDEGVIAFIGGATGSLAFIRLSALPAPGRWSRAQPALVSPPFGRKGSLTEREPAGPVLQRGDRAS